MSKGHKVLADIYANLKQYILALRNWDLRAPV